MDGDTFEALRRRVVVAGGGTVAEGPHSDLSNLAITLVMHDVLPNGARDGFQFLCWLKNPKELLRDGIPDLRFGHQEMSVFEVDNWRADIDTFDPERVVSETTGWVTSVSYRFHTADIFVDHIDEIDRNDALESGAEYHESSPEETMMDLARKMHALDEVVRILNTSPTVRAVPLAAFDKAAEWIGEAIGEAVLPLGYGPEELDIPEDVAEILKLDWRG